MKQRLQQDDKEISMLLWQRQDLQWMPEFIEKWISHYC
jgi:hypothetical protein